MIDKKILIRGISFAGYFIVVFLFFLLLLFPYDRIRTKLESEVRQRTPLELTVARISPRFFDRFLLLDVVVSDKQGKILFETPTVNTTVSLFSLLTGGLSVDMKAPAYGGQLLVKLRQNSKNPRAQYFMFDADGLDVGSYTLLKNAGFKISGKIGGNFEMNGDAGKGRLWIKDAATRELKIKGFPVPDLDFEKGWLEAEVKGDRMIIKKLELEGKELKITATGDLLLREKGTMNLTFRFKPSERLSHEQAGILSLLKNRDSEGFYQFTLGGMITEPMPRL